MIIQIVGGIVRTVLAAYGGKLVESGLITADQLSQGIGAIIVVLTLLWSIWQKRRAATTPGGAFNPNAEVRKAKRP
jgi:uncharacterized membrane protein YdjX (TVP38/TMEM64 family)